MAKIKSIILKGVYNENFEEIIYNQKDDINTYKKLAEQHKKPEGEGMVHYSNRVYYYKTFIPEQKNQSIFYIIFCSKSFPKDKIEECFEEIYEILEKNKKFSLKNFPKIIIEEINEIFLRLSNNDIDSNLNITESNNETKINSQEISTLQFNIDIDNKLISETNQDKIIKVDKKIINLTKKIKYIYLISCFILLIFFVFTIRFYLLEK